MNTLEVKKVEYLIKTGLLLTKLEDRLEIIRPIDKTIKAIIQGDHIATKVHTSKYPMGITNIHGKEHSRPCENIRDPMATIEPIHIATTGCPLLTN